MAGGQCYEIPDEVRKKMSHSMMGNKNGLGHPCSEEKKRKISEAQKGRRLTEEHKEKLSKAKKGKPRKPLSEETRKKISDSHAKRPVYCIETDTVYPSVQECARQLHIDATSVSRICRGKCKSLHGFHLQYYENNTQ